MKESKMISIDLVEPNPYQPRLEFNDDALMDLAQSIRENGLIQPLTVREVDGKYQIVAGERRFRAMKLNGAVEIPAIVMDANEIQMAEMALLENIQRENLSAIEEAKSYVEIMKYAGLSGSVSLIVAVSASDSVSATADVSDSGSVSLVTAVSDSDSVSTANDVSDSDSDSLSVSTAAPGCRCGKSRGRN